ncbi:MAG: nicotinate-nucleotide adenylyltransferase [Prevotella sp.]|nr:nicotinate-nucleotide adenylyltransferase [Prevotella sp.]
MEEDINHSTARATKLPTFRKGKKVGIYGGSFNPIHRGHIALARQMLRKAHLDEVWFLVSPLNPFKQASTDLLYDQTRLLLTRQALADEPRLVASDYEFHLPRPSYSWDTLQALSRDYPEHEFVLVIGADNWLAFDRWYHAEDILDSYPIVIYPREGCPIDAATLPPTVRLVKTRLYNVSSTDIRRRIREGRPVRRLLPPAVHDAAVAAYSAGSNATPSSTP